MDSNISTKGLTFVLCKIRKILLKNLKKKIQYKNIFKLTVQYTDIQIQGWKEQNVIAKQRFFA